MLDRYSKTFFWIFVVLGVLWGWQERALIDYYFSAANFTKAVDSVLGQPGNLHTNPQTPESIGDFLGLLVIGVFILVLGIIASIFWIIGVMMLLPVVLVGFVLYKFHLHPLLIGAIISYPFYVVFLNLFEFFLLLLIRDPDLNDIKYLTHWRELSFGRLAEVATKLALAVPPVGSDTPVLASTILTRQWQKAKKVMDVEIGAMRRYREEKIRQALKKYYEQEQQKQQ